MRCDLRVAEINARAMPVRTAQAAAGHALELSLSWLLPRAIPSDLFMPFQRLLGRQTLVAAACPLATIEINACVAPVPAAKAAAGHTLELSLRWLLPRVIPSDLFVPFSVCWVGELSS